MSLAAKKKWYLDYLLIIVVCYTKSSITHSKHDKRIVFSIGEIMYINEQ